MPEPMDKTDIESIVGAAVQDAVSFIETEIAEDRLKAQRYFDGKVDIGEEEGRSKVVSTKVRDTVRAIKPSLMRVFLSSDNPVEFVPTGPEDVMNAEFATKYVSYKFNQLDGYRIINDAFHDALVKKTGFVKVYWDSYSESTTHEFTNLTDDEMYVLASDDSVEILEHTETITMMMDPSGVEIETPIHDMKVSVSKDKGKLCIESVPPEEVVVSADAKTKDDAYVIAHRTEMRAGDLVAMGYDQELVSNLSSLSDSDSYRDQEREERRGYYDDDDKNIRDESMRLVAVTEAYMRMDVEGTGIPQLYKFLLGGNDYTLLDHEPYDTVPFAVFEIDPEPHTFFGRSAADLIMNDQDASTAMLRGVLDNVALVNNPRTQFVEGQVNVDDLMNNEIGGLVRTRAPGMVQDLSVPFVAGQTLSAIQYMDDLVEQKTGITKASMGLDPDALQSSTRAAVNATVQGAAAQTEVIARNLAEGGMTQLFKLVLGIMIENSDEQEMMRFNGQFVPIDPRSWDADMDVTVNVGLGTGQEEQKAAALQQTLQTQFNIWNQYGHDNGLVTMTNIRNTLADLNSLFGVRNNDRYYQPMNQQLEAQFTQRKLQEQAQQPQPMDQAQAYIEAEKIKSAAKAQTDMAKLQIEAQKALAEDDRERDQMDQDLLVDAAKIYGQYGTNVEVAKIKQAQAQPRYPAEAPVNAVQGGRF